MNSFNDILKSLRSIFENEVRIYSLKGVEKSSVLLGLIATIFVLSALGFIGLIFASVALAAYLNTLLDSAFLGYLIISSGYIVIIVLLLLGMMGRKAPLFTNIFIRRLISIFNISDDEDK
jgi:hypothetical protein